MFSKIVRRTHMYLALFLAPWMLMYGLSTLAMNHRRFFEEIYGPGPPPFVKERELTYDGVFPPGADAKVVASQLLVSLNMDGAHGATRRASDGAVVINRNDFLEPRRITYTPADGKVVIEKMPYRTNTFLERAHRRRGFAQAYIRDDLWAFSVDLVIAAMIFWVLSGLWMWWELKVTRVLGALFMLGGASLFVFYLATL